MSAPASPRTLLHHLVEFGGQLRANGIPVNPAGLIDLCRALELIGWQRREDVCSAARANLVTRREQLPTFERLFAAYWAGLDQAPDQQTPRGGQERPTDSAAPGREQRQARLQRLVQVPDTEPAGDSFSDANTAWSDADVLTYKDLGRMDPQELLRARQLMAGIVKALLNRPGRRHRSSSRPREIDFRRSFRRGLSRGFDGLELRYRQRKPGKLKLLLLCDVSGSMQRYSEFLLHFIYALRDQLPDMEAAVFATHMTPITAPLREPDSQQSLRRLAREARGWGGGTDIGQALLEFNDWYSRELGHSRTAMVILSDGWDRGDARVMRRELARLRRRVQQLVWLNPLLGATDYQPLVGGIRLALPYLDHFLPAHNLASLAQVARLLQRIR